MCFSGSSKEAVKTPEPQPTPTQNPVLVQPSLTPTIPSSETPTEKVQSSPLPPSLESVPLSPPTAKTGCQSPEPLPPPEEKPVNVVLEKERDELPTSKPVPKQPEKPKPVEQAILHVKVYKKGDPTHIFGAATVKSTLAGSKQTPMETGIAEFGTVATGKHLITVTLQGDAAKKFIPPTAPVEQVLANGDNITVNIEVEPKIWTLKVTVESTTAFGWPKDAVNVEFPTTSIASKTVTLTAKTGEVTVTGEDDATGTAKATVANWTLEKEEPITLTSGDSKTVTLKLKGVDEAFLLVDAGTPPAPVKDENVTLLREDGTPVPGAPAKTDADGKVKLNNVPPEKYKIKFPDRYDAEWEFDKYDNLT